MILYLFIAFVISFLRSVVIWLPLFRSFVFFICVWVLSAFMVLCVVISFFCYPPRYFFRALCISFVRYFFISLCLSFFRYVVRSLVIYVCPSVVPSFPFGFLYCPRSFFIDLFLHWCLYLFIVLLVRCSSVISSVLSLFRLFDVMWCISFVRSCLYFIVCG